jgi:hypothetical protein
VAVQQRHGVSSEAAHHGQQHQHNHNHSHHAASSSSDDSVRVSSNAAVRGSPSPIDRHLLRRCCTLHFAVAGWRSTVFCQLSKRWSAASCIFAVVVQTCCS